MEHQEQEFYAPRENKQSRYDKRLILKIVREVEAGLPRKEANRIYELGKASLDGWKKQYGSPEYKENMRRKNYTNLQKRTVVAAIEQGRGTNSLWCQNGKNNSELAGAIQKRKSRTLYYNRTCND